MARKYASVQPPTVEDLLCVNAQLRREIAELEAFRTLAYRDQLTGLWNRRYFVERMNEELGRARRHHDRRLLLMAVDVNELKSINDSRGHAAGDLALRWVAEFLERSLRAHDVCCRTGGDEFAVIFPEIGLEAGKPIVHRLRAALADASAGMTYPIGLSLGMAGYPHHGTSFDELVRLADDAMYGDKRRQKLAPDAPPASASPVPMTRPSRSHAKT